MHKRLLLILFSVLFVVLSIQSGAVLYSSAATAKTRSIPAPEDVLGFRPGDDRKLASWAKVVEYFKKLATASDRVNFEEIGKSTMGAPFVYATISAPENLKRLAEFKEIQRQLADPCILGSPTNPALADRKAPALIARGKTIKHPGQCSRPALSFTFGLRPNSPTAITRVEAKSPRSCKSASSADIAWSSHGAWRSCMIWKFR